MTAPLSAAGRANEASELSFFWKESRESLLRLLEKGRKLGWHRVGQPFPHLIEDRSGWGVWITIALD